MIDNFVLEKNNFWINYIQIEIDRSNLELVYVKTKTEYVVDQNSYIKVVKTILQRSVVDWLDENIQGEWEFVSSVCAIGFLNEEDATGFKLRWL